MIDCLVFAFNPPKAFAYLPVFAVVEVEKVEEVLVAVVAVAVAVVVVVVVVASPLANPPNHS